MSDVAVAPIKPKGVKVRPGKGPSDANRGKWKGGGVAQAPKIDPEELREGILLLHDAGWEPAKIVARYNLKAFYVKWVIDTENARRKVNEETEQKLVDQYKRDGIKGVVLPKVLRSTMHSMDDLEKFDAGRMGYNVGKGAGIFKGLDKSAPPNFDGCTFNFGSASDPELEEALNARRKQLRECVRLGILDAGTAQAAGITIDVAAEPVDPSLAGIQGDAGGEGAAGAVAADGAERGMVAPKPNPDVRQALEAGRS